VHFITDADEVQPLLHSFDIAVHTAKSESGPLVLIEYLAQNLPFVTYNTGETVLQLKDALPWCIANSFEANEWISKIENILSADQQVLAHQLQTVFETVFSAEAYYSQCLGIYEKCLATS
jgi:glycosyltransferase involved in cell wall biosynthesis